ncbi:MAG: ankyrin repeat domain-containing protein [Turneriella sp.]|nr:ankyrin repeat domain-containing protein [Turneriella sp.]
MNAMKLSVGLAFSATLGILNCQTMPPGPNDDLHRAASKGNLAGVSAALSAGADINSTDRGMTPLKWSANLGHIEVARLLLQKGADPDRGYPIITASAHGYLEIVKLLVSKGADIKATDENGMTAFYWSKDHPEVQAYLNEQAIAAKESVTPLMMAAKKGDIEGVQQRLAAGDDLNLTDVQGETAIYKACAASHIDVVKLLIKAKADVNIATKYGGETPVIVAAQKGYDDIITLLIKARAIINPKPQRFLDNQTALMAAARKGHASTVSLLIKAKARLNDQDDKGRTALFQASESGQAEVVKILIKAGAKLNVQGPMEHTALSIARTEEVHKLLKAAGAK